MACLGGTGVGRHSIKAVDAYDHYISVRHGVDYIATHDASDVLRWRPELSPLIHQVPGRQGLRRRRSAGEDRDSQEPPQAVRR